MNTEPTRSRLDDCFLPGRRQAPCQRASPFFPEVQEELTRSWRAPYSARLRASSSSALTSVDGAEEKGYGKLPPLDESVTAHPCPPTAIGWTAKAAHPSKPCRTTQDAPTHRLDKQPLHFTPWRSSKSSRPNSSSDADGDQGCGQGPLPGLTSLPHWPVRTRCGRVRGVLHCGTEVVPGNATLPAKSAPAPKLARVAPDLC